MLFEAAFVSALGEIRFLEAEGAIRTEIPKEIAEMFGLSQARN